LSAIVKLEQLLLIPLHSSSLQPPPFLFDRPRKTPIQEKEAQSRRVVWDSLSENTKHLFVAAVDSRHSPAAVAAVAWADDVGNGQSAVAQA
jgi:hypothetical protein